MASEGYVAVHDGPFRVNHSVTIITDPASPFSPSFDCLGRSSLLVANATHDPSSMVSISGMRVRNGRSGIGGTFHLLAGSVRLHDLTISRSTAITRLKNDAGCSSSIPPDECLRGGGAVSVQATSAWMDGISIHNSSTPLSWGAINILDTPFVRVSNAIPTPPSLVGRSLLLLRHTHRIAASTGRSAT